MRGIPFHQAQAVHIPGNVLHLEFCSFSCFPCFKNESSSFTMFMQCKMMGIYSFGTLDCLASLLFLPVKTSLYAWLNGRKKDTWKFGIFLCFFFYNFVAYFCKLAQCIWMHYIMKTTRISYYETFQNPSYFYLLFFHNIPPF